MTVEELIYGYYMDNRKERDALFNLYKRGSDISKIQNRRTLRKGSQVQPTDLYDKNVVKFWIESISNTFVSFGVIYE